MVEFSASRLVWYDTLCKPCYILCTQEPPLKKQVGHAKMHVAIKTCTCVCVCVCVCMEAVGILHQSVKLCPSRVCNLPHLQVQSTKIKF